MSIEWIKKISTVEKKKTKRKTRRCTSAVTAWNLQATCRRISELPLIRRLEMATIAIVLWQCLDGIMSRWRMALISLGIRRAPMQETNRHRQQAAVWGCKSKKKKKKKKKVLKVRAVVSRILVWIVALLMIFQSWLFITIFIYWSF